MSRRSSQAAASAVGGGKTQLESHAAYHVRMDAALGCLRTLLSPSQATSKAWRPVQAQQTGAAASATTSATASGSANANGGHTGASLPASSSLSSGLDIGEAVSTLRSAHNDQSLALLGQPGPVHVHRRSAARGAREHNTTPAAPLLPPGSSPGADIYRAVCCIPLKSSTELSDLAWNDIQDSFRRLVATPECRQLWDQMVEGSEVVEELNAYMRICRTVFKLGWPASPRDAITLSRTLMDSQSLVDISCSLPRSADAPVYLRPAPPYVRSHINMFAWCLERSTIPGVQQPCLKLTAFWSWDLRGAWVGMPAGGLGARLPLVVNSLALHVTEGVALRVPYLSYFGRSVEVTSRTFDVTRDMVTVEYQVICDEDGDLALTSQRDLTLEWSLPAAEGWDVHIDVKALESHKHSSAEWTCSASQAVKGIDANGEYQSARIMMSMQHVRSEAPGGRSLLAEGLRGRMTVQRIAASHDVRLRVNGEPREVMKKECEDRSVNGAARILELSSGSAGGGSSVGLGLLDDAVSISNASFRSENSSNSTTVAGESIDRVTTPSSIAASDRPGHRSQRSDVVGSPQVSSLRAAPDRQTALTNIVRRNYIYFTSLLQEPEAKWKHFSDNRGVTITQLDSIDPTLVVYRAEATFVGVGVWDLFAAIANPGVRSFWNKGTEESRLVDDLNDTSKLWWNKVRGAWPVAPRDSVTVETVYKSPSSIHLFAFSTDDRKLFPAIPAPDTGAIRTQIDLRGWSIESLSPTTAHITLIEQSDPKGWTSKAAATPAAMTAVVAGVGDFAIKQGGPPIVTRLLGAKMRTTKYESDRASYRVEYELAAQQQDAADGTVAGGGNVECELRCDVETWSPSLDVVIDPPPIHVSCLRRHKLSQGGSGLWLTIEQPVASLEDDASRITVRKASNKEKGVVYVNGARMKVDVDELKDDEVTQLREQKRTKPKRVPLDLVSESPRKPMIGSASPMIPISRSATPASVAAVEAASVNLAAITGGSAGATGAGGSAAIAAAAAAGRASSPLGESHSSDVFSDEKPRQPMTCALDVLFLLRRIHAERSPDPAGNPAGWSLISNRNGLYTRRKMMHSISPTVIVQRSDKVVEGLTAEDILSIVSHVSCRRLWDDKVESATLLESYGNGATSSFFTTKAGFPFRGRAFYLASLTARSGPSATQMGNPSAPTVYFHASSSYPERNAHFSASKLNPTALPMGKVLIDGWIVETLDPYSSTLNYQIPSTRVTHLIAVDYAGSLPVAVNAMWNAQLSRSIVQVEDLLKSRGTLPSVRCPPFCVEVLGDGRDEDHDLIWSLEDDKSKRGCTMVSADYDPASHVYRVVVTLDSSTFSHEAVTTPLAMPFPRRAALSNASTTRGLAAAASLTASPVAESTATENPRENGIFSTDEAAGGLPISRTTSVNSLRSISSKSRPSVVRKESKKPSDFVVADMEVELRHFEHGYDIVTASELGKAVGSDEANDKSDTQSLAEKEGVSEGGEELKQQQPWPLNSSNTANTLPLQVSSFDLPPSAVLAATLDPASRPKKHLVRLSLPTTAFLDARSNPLYGPTPDDAPDWYRKVRDRGASIRVTITPRKGDDTRGVNQDAAAGSTNVNTTTTKSVSGSSTPSDSGTSDGGDMDSQNIPVFYKGQRIAVTHVNQTSAMLQRESENEQSHAVLKRIVPPPPPRVDGQAVIPARNKRPQDVLEDRLPLLLQKPIAVATEYGQTAQKGLAVASVDDDGLSPSSSIGDMTAIKTPTAHRAGETPKASNASLTAAGTATPTPAAAPSTPASAASMQIMNILNSYPLSRLGGASTAVSTTVANGGVFSRRGGAGTANGDSERGEGGGQKGPADGVSSSDGGQRGAHVADHEDASALVGMPGQLIATTELIRKRMTDVKFSWSTVVLVAVIAFLFGSLVRSLLEPADFVLVNRLTSEKPVTDKAAMALGGHGDEIQAAAVREIKRALSGGDHGGMGDGGALPTVAWRELKRLLELRNVFGGRWDLVIAVARR